MAIRSKVAVPILDIQGGVNCERAGFAMGESERLGTLPVVLCSVRMTSKGIRGFVRCCELRNIQVRPAGSGAELSLPTVENVAAAAKAFGSEVFECVGGLEHLEYLTGHPSVVEWGFVDRTVRRVGFSPQGQGEVKPVPRKTFRDPEPCDWVKANNAVRQASEKGDTTGLEVMVSVLAENKPSE